jgi:hypothetical protein
MARTSYFRLDDDHVRFVLDQNTELDFNNASSLKQQSAGRHFAPLGHIILIPSQIMSLDTRIVFFVTTPIAEVLVIALLKPHRLYNG